MEGPVSPLRFSLFTAMLEKIKSRILAFLAQILAFIFTYFFA